jgi:hypothetical protein
MSDAHALVLARLAAQLERLSKQLMRRALAFVLDALSLAEALRRAADSYSARIRSRSRAERAERMAAHGVRKTTIREDNARRRFGSESNPSAAHGSGWKTRSGGTHALRFPICSLRTTA